MRGNLQQSTLAVLVRHFYAERKSGTLHVSSHGLERRIYFRKGLPIFADAGAGERLPARPQAEAILCSTFSWTVGEFSFQDGEPPVDDKLVLAKPPAEMILEGTRSIDDPRALDRLLGANGTVFACSQSTELPLFSVKLSPAESAILKLAREQERFQASDVAHVSGEFSVRRALNALVSLGLLQIVSKEQAPEPAPAPPQPKPVSIPARPPVPPPPVLAPVPEPEPAPPPPKPRSIPARPPAPPPPVLARVPEPEPEPAPQLEPVFEPEPVPPEPVHEVPREVEQLFDRFEAKRVREAPKPRVAPVYVIDDAPEEELPPSVGAIAHAGPTLAPRRAAASGPSRKIWGFVALGGLAVLALALVLWLTKGESPKTEPDVVVSEAPPEIPPEPPPIEPAALPGPAPIPSVTELAVPSEAELFYQANLAVENRDFDRARLELETLLELKPDFTAAKTLLARVERELAAAEAPAPPAPKPAPPPKPVVARVEAKREETKAPEPAKPDPAEIFAAAKDAFNRGDLDRAESKLGEVRALDPTHAGARELREQLEQRRWEQALPQSYRARHDHRIGGCDGTVNLTAQGIGYRSSEHEWFWSFAELARTDRKSERQLAVETRGKNAFKFQLHDALSASDWTRFLTLSR